MRERRRHRRVEVMLRIRTLDLTTPIGSQLVNLSESGLLFYTGHSFRIGQLIGIDLSDPSTADSLLIKARVLRSSELGDDERAVAVEFMEVPPRERGKLKEIVRRMGFSLPRIILSVQDGEVRELVGELLQRNRYEIVRARTFEELKKAAKMGDASLVFAEVGGSEKELKELHRVARGKPIVIISQKTDAALRSRAAFYGIYECVEKPLEPEKFYRAMSQAIRASRHSGASSEKDEEGRETRVRLVARSKAMERIVDEVKKLARVSGHVMITGETGVGKETVAKEIHRLSDRGRRKIVIADCSKINPNLIESAVFGHEKGAFTGAVGRHKGYVERAQDSTLFLDEIGSLPIYCQKMLLRLVDTGEYERVGGEKALNSDARIIVATNRNLSSMVNDGSFRMDLYYRLCVYKLYISPLRDRREDLMELAIELIQELNEKCQANVNKLGPEATDQLLTHDWPGNVRELRNVLERSLAGQKGNVLHSLNIEAWKSETPDAIISPAGTPPPSTSWKSFQENLESQVKEYLEQLVHKHKGKISEAATHAGMTQQNLSKKLKKYGIRTSDFK